MRPIVQVRNLSKLYRVGRHPAAHPSLPEALARLFKSPFARRDGRAPGQDGRLWALEDLSFEVEASEVVGIIGRNGAGKSTLLKILSRIIRPTAGEVDIYGRTGSLLEIGTGFHPDLTGNENIYLNGAILGMKREEIKRKFDEIVAFAGVERFLQTAVKHYSSGMYLRLAFAVAAHFEPEILILDEVLAVGDAAFRKKCMGKMKEVSREGRTIFFVSHDLAAVRQLCRRALLIEGGCLLEDGSAESVIASYLSVIADREAPAPRAAEQYGERTQRH